MGLLYTTAQAAGRAQEKCKHKKFSSVRKAADSQAPNVERSIREGYQKYRTEILNDIAWRTADHHIENLVFSGGGIKSYAFIGALQALQDCGALSKVKRLSGSSGGAICAGLMAVGFNPQEIADIFSPDATWLFKDQPMLPLFCLPNVFKKFGIHPAKRLYDYFGVRFKEKCGDADVTFKQIYDRLGRELIIPVTNLTTRQCEYCHHTTTPDLSIRLAMRMTMSFPVMYQPVSVEINGKKSTYLDGGTLDHYPIHVFDGSIYDVNQNKSEGAYNRNSATLGMYVMTEKATDYHIWRTLFERELPNRPFYVPDTKLARSRLKERHPLKAKGRQSQRGVDKLSCVGSMARAISTRDLAPLLLWPETERDIQIKNFGDFFLAAIETVMVNHRKLLVKVILFIFTSNESVIIQETASQYKTISISTSV